MRHGATRPAFLHAATPRNRVPDVARDALSNIAPVEATLGAMHDPATPEPRVEPRDEPPGKPPEPQAVPGPDSGPDSGPDPGPAPAPGPAPGPERAPAVAPAEALTAAVRILPPRRERDPTFPIALGLVFLAHLGFVAGALHKGRAPESGGERAEERRGQVEVSETITVELVEDPDGASRSKLSQMGAESPPGPQSPPSPPADAQQAEPHQPAREPAKPVEQAQPSPRPKEPPPVPDAVPELSLEDFDTTMDAYAAAIERAQAEQRRRADPRTAEAQRIKGAAAQGTQSAYSKSVTTALARNKPKVYLSRGSVYVQFELDRTGALRYVRVAQSSGDPLLDQTGVDAIRKTTFPPPPPDVDPRDLRYTIHYVFN